MRPTVVSTFAGCGGSSLGYRMAGYDERLAVEWDRLAAESFRRNFAEVQLFEGDIHDLRGEDALVRTGLAAGELDVFDGSPPCQGFSTSGKRRADDPRSQLYVEYIRLLEVFRPKVFVMENVSGLVKGKMLATTFVQIMKSLRAAGYRVSCRRLDARFFGVPQSRQRVIFVGVREDLGVEPSHPSAQQPPIPVRVAFRDVEPTTFCPRPLNETERLVWASTNPGQDGAELEWSRGRFWDHHKLHPRRPAPTLRASYFGALMHWSEARRLSIEECKAIMGFPQDFELVGSFGEKWKQLGNGVPPPLMKAVAEHIRDEILAPAVAA